MLCTRQVMHAQFNIRIFSLLNARTHRTSFLSNFAEKREES